MRTLSRPMFNMGGPIKQGVMHGIREPYKGGGKAALVGNPVYPKTGGREHHAVVSGTIAAGVGLNALRHAAMRYGSRYLPRMWQGAKRMFGTTTPASVTQGSKLTARQASKIFGQGSGTASQVTMNPAKFNPNWLGRDPLVQSVGWAGKTLTGPTSKNLAGKAFQFATAPSTIVGGVVWYLWPDGSKRKTPPPGNMIGAGPLHGVKDPTPSIPEPTVKSQAEKDAFAKSQREIRVNKYLDMMGYDRSKKMAIADALIDASKIVGDRGSLDPKNITQELINPIIQATSKRLDKPQQIREAVGLMMTKAGLEKEMYDAKPGTMMKNIQDLVASGMSEQEAKDIVLKQSKGVGSDIMGYMAAQKGKVKAEQLENIARLSAYDHKMPFKKMTDEEVAAIPELEGKTPFEIVSTQKTDGVYMVGDIVFQIEGGKPTQLTFG